MKSLIATIFTTLFLSVSANAGILIEPYAGLILSGDAQGEKITGNEMGARLGYSTLGFGFGLDATVVGPYKYETSGDYKPMHMGVFASYTFPILVRAYATYFVNAKLTDSNSDWVSGNATKIGVQYTGLPFLAIGVETFTMNYSELESGGVKSSASGSQSQTRLALSVPFDL